MQHNKSWWPVATALTVALCITAPAHAGVWPFKKKTEEQPAQAEQAAAPAQAAPEQAKPAGHPAWMNDQGEVINAAEAEEGYGQKVTGINGWEGEITGKPVPGSKFNELKIGMPTKQVVDIVGQPTDQGMYMTGKAWIPFYQGSGRSRTEYVYKGLGRLIFDGKGGFDSGSNLVWIIHSGNEDGYRD